MLKLMIPYKISNAYVSLNFWRGLRVIEIGLIPECRDSLSEVLD